MSLLPIPRRASDPLALQAQQAAALQRRAELQIFEHGAQAWTLSEMDRQDSEALGRALGASLDVEVGLLRYGLRLANGDPAVVELTARKVEVANAMSNQRIARRFGMY